MEKLPTNYSDFNLNKSLELVTLQNTVFRKALVFGKSVTQRIFVRTQDDMLTVLMMVGIMKVVSIISCISVVGKKLTSTNFPVSLSLYFRKKMSAGLQLLNTKLKGYYGEKYKIRGFTCFIYNIKTCEVDNIDFVLNSVSKQNFGDSNKYSYGYNNK